MLLTSWLRQLPGLMARRSVRGWKRKPVASRQVERQCWVARPQQVECLEDRALLAVSILGTTAGNSFSGTILTLPNFSVGSGNDRLLLVSTGYFNGPSGITFNGMPLSQVVSQGSPGAFAAIWELPLGSGPSIVGNVVVTYAGPGSAFAAATAFSGVDQTTPVTSFRNNSSSLAVSTAIGDMVLDAITTSNFSGSPTLSPSQTSQGVFTILNTDKGGVSTAAGNGGNVSMGWTATGAFTSHVGVNIHAPVTTTAPTVTSPTATSITATTATLGGNVTSDGGNTVTARGVVYSLTSANANPQLGGTGVTNVTGIGTTGVFTVDVTGLTASSGYSFAAYATNSIGTTYSSVATFSTLAAPVVADFVVTTLDDEDDLQTTQDADLSLREAIRLANADSDASTITFAASLFTGGDQTVSLSLFDTGGDDGEAGATALFITSPVTIEGPAGDNGVTIERSSSAGEFRLLHVKSTGALTLNRVTLSGGSARGPSAVSASGPQASGGGGAAGLGGAIFNQGALTILNSTLSGNTAQGGNGAEGLLNGSGGAGLGGSNSGPVGGGPNGAFFSPAGFGGGGAGGTGIGPSSQRHGGFGGGGGGANSGGNGGFGGGGGGRYSDDSSAGSLGVGGFGAGNGGTGRYTIGAGGGGAGLGGAVFNESGTVTITNSSFGSNTATGGNGGSAASTPPGGTPGANGQGLGGAVFTRNGNVTVLNSTFSENSAAQGGGAIFAVGDSNSGSGFGGGNVTLTLNNTILANTAAGASDFAATTIASGMNSFSGVGNLIESNGASAFTGTIVSSSDPMLAAQADNGGPTKTFALSAGSPAIDSGDSVSGAAAGNFDQRGNGFDRAVGVIDIGAFEFSGPTDTEPPTLASPISISDTSLKIDDTATVTFTFSEAVSGFTIADVTAENGVLSDLTTGDGGITWTAMLTANAATTDSSNVLTLDLTGITDLASNAGVGTADSGNYAIDTVRPTATITVNNTSLTIGETSSVMIVFSEAVTGFTNAALTITNGKLSSVTTTDNITFTATLAPNSGVEDATNVITLDNTGVSDVSGNAGTGTTNSNNYAIDTVRPTATVTVDDTSLIIGEMSSVTIVFSEAVTSFTNADLTIANGTLSSVSTSDNITFTAMLTPDSGVEDATNVITLDNTGVSDVSGNAGTSTTNSNNYAVDTVRPTADIVDVEPDARSGPVSSINVTFSEAVTGVDIGDFTLTRNGTPVSLATASLAGSLTSYTISGLSTRTNTEGTYVLTLLSSGTGITDAAGNEQDTGVTDDWLLLSTRIASSGNTITITDIVGASTVGNTNDNIILTVDPTNPNILVITVEGRIVTRSLVGVTNLVFNAGVGNDVLTLDFVNGSFPFDVTFNGGTGGNDSLVVRNSGASAGLLNATYDNLNDGTLNFMNGAASRMVTFTGLEPITVEGSLTEVIFNLPNTNDTGVTLSLQPSGLLRLSGGSNPTFEMTDIDPTGVTAITINGNGGNDQITIGDLGAYAGTLTVNGGAGNDVINASASSVAVTLQGGLGTDLLTGSSRADSLDGGAGNDQLFGQAGNDTLQGGAGNDLLDGQTGTADCLTDITTQNFVLSNGQLVGNGTDTLANIECVQLFGNASKNTLDASRFTLGPVELHGGDGNDVLIGSSANDLLDGGNGTDTVQQSSSGNQTIVGTTISSPSAGTDTLLSVEGVSLIVSGRTGAKLDATAAAFGVTLTGGSGNDTLCGSSRTDSLVGGAGQDLLVGNDGNDTLRGGTGNDRLEGNDSDDQLFGDAGSDLIFGGDGQDVISGGVGSDTILGEVGHDTINGNLGNDAISGGAGDDLLDGDLGSDTVLGGVGNDILRNAGGSDRLAGGTGNDRFFASGSRINLGGGDDTISGSNNTIDAVFLFDFDKLLV